MLIVFAFFQRNYSKKLKSNYKIFLLGGLLFIGSSFIFLWLSNMVINLTLFFVICLLFAYICFDISFKSAIIQSIIIDAIMFSTELLTIFCSSAILGARTSLFLDKFLAYIILSFISKILFLIFSQILSLVIKNGYQEVPNIKHFLPLFIFPALTLVTCSVFMLLALDFNFSRGYQITIFGICMLLIFACIFVFIYYQLLLKSEEKIRELQKEQEYNNLNSTYLEVLQHQNDELQMLFHDTKNHYITLNSFDNISEVKAYINKLYPELIYKNHLRITSNKMLDLILSKYTVICQNQHIHFSCEVQTADLKYIDDMELSIILNNALDNAVEAAVNSEEKIIDFSLRHNNHMDMLSIVNSCDSSPSHRGIQLITSKKQLKNHGWGSKIIEQHVRANHGEYDWFYSPDEKRFHLLLLFQNQPEQSSKKQTS